MKLSCVFSVAALVAGTSAAATLTQQPPKTCLQPANVQDLVDAYYGLVTNYNRAHGERWIADTFRHTSSSINNLSGKPLDSVTYATKAEFLKAAAAEAPTPIKIQSVGPVDCDTFAIIFTDTFGKAQQQARAIVIFGAVETEVGWQIRSIDIELNTLAFALNLGGNYTLPEHGHA